MNEIEEMEDQKITVEINGEMVECDVLFTYDSEAVDRTIIGYTDNTYGDNGALNILVSKYDPFFGPNKLEPVTEPEDVEICKKIIQDIIKQYKQ